MTNDYYDDDENLLEEIIQQEQQERLRRRLNNEALENGEEYRYILTEYIKQLNNILLSSKKKAVFFSLPYIAFSLLHY